MRLSTERYSPQLMHFKAVDRFCVPHLGQTFIFMFTSLSKLSQTAQRLVLAAVGGSVDSPSKRKKLKATKMPKKRAAYPPSAAPVMMASDHFIQEKQGCNSDSILRSGKHASSPSGKAMESGAYPRQLPRCTMVSGQIDLDTGGGWATPMRKLIPLSDRACPRQRRKAQ